MARKTEPGAELTDIADVVSAWKGGYWLYYRHKPYHPAFIAGWPFRRVLSAIRGGQLRWCLSTADGEGLYRSEPTWRSA